MNYIVLALNYVLPHHLLSRMMYRFSRMRWEPLRTLSIRFVVRRYGLHLAEAAPADVNDRQAYPHLNSVFTRALQPQARPICNARSLCCPADGRISQIGKIHGESVFQAKGKQFSLTTLLGGSEQRAQAFANGDFATIYLSPKDYHRVHMPLTGQLMEMVYIPGRLFSVSPFCTEKIPQLFARNERLVCVFDTASGPMAVILVGALFVGSISTVWSGQITPRRGQHRTVEQWRYGKETLVQLEKGAELGRFNFGSTVIVLLGKEQIHWAENAASEVAVRMGESLGNLRERGYTESTGVA